MAAGQDGRGDRNQGGWIVPDSIPIGSRFHPKRAPLWASDSLVEGTEEWIGLGRGIEEPVV